LLLLKIKMTNSSATRIARRYQRSSNWFINSVRTSQETRYVSATETNRLMLFRKTVAVYCKNHTEHINTLCGRKEEFFSVKSLSTSEPTLWLHHAVLSRLFLVPQGVFVALLFLTVAVSQVLCGK
jgi:hypothetical protein